MEKSLNHLRPEERATVMPSKKSALFRIVWKSCHAGVLFKKGLAGRSVNFPVVKKMMLVRLRSDWNPRALTMAA